MQPLRGTRTLLAGSWRIISGERQKPCCRRRPATFEFARTGRDIADKISRIDVKSLAVAPGVLRHDLAEAQSTVHFAPFVIETGPLRGRPPLSRLRVLVRNAALLSALCLLPLASLQAQRNTNFSLPPSSVWQLKAPALSGALFARVSRP
jgi:hypothetical protein